VELSRPVFFSAIALAVLSAASSAYLAFGRSASVAASPAGEASCACDDAALKRELAELRKAVDARGDGDVKQLSARVAALEKRPASAGAGTAGDDGERPAPSAPPAAAPEPKYTSFDLPSKALSVRQDEDGTLRVTNTDPAMSGKFLRITGRDQDGATHDISIVVPPPGQ
jgi:hypothetical protein